MRDAFQIRILAIALALATLAAAVLGFLNQRQESRFDVPTDGVWWLESKSGLRAERVPEDSPAFRAGVRAEDAVLAVNEHPVPSLASLERQLFRSGIWAHATYSILRTAHRGQFQAPAHLDIQLILEPTDRSANDGLRLIALTYLGIGIYVLFRRWTAPQATHFYVFCLASFVLYAFRFTGALDGFDWTIYWANTLAAAVQPALFLHFAVSFSGGTGERQRDRTRRRLLIAALYLPGASVVLLQLVAITRWSATALLKHRLEQISVGYLALYYVVAAVVFRLRYSRAESALERQQLKWLSRGTLLAVAPYTLFYAVPYMADFAVPGLLTKAAGLSLVLLPLTFSYAIVRYRLMDTDLIFKRGVSYTLATAALVGVYFLVVAVAAELVHTRLPNLRLWGLVAAVTITGIVFDPLKRAIQGRVDRLFDQKRIDYRETLVDFGRSLNAQTDLRTLLDLIVERLPQTLLVTRVAVFLADEQAPRSGSGFTLAASHGLGAAAEQPEALDLGFLDFDRPGANNHLFLETPQHVLRLGREQRTTAALLDLNYYLPCRAAYGEGLRSRAVAVLGFGRTRHDDFLSSEDVELLESLASYIGIAIQNAQLYRRLERQIAEFERLKEFNENILESINVGVFAIDLEDCIESWNPQMELLFGRTRKEVLKQPLQTLFPPEFFTVFEQVRHGSGTHTFYKFRLPLPAGEVRTANIAVAPLMSKEAIPLGHILLVDDITERVQLEKQLTQSEKLSSIGLLAAGVAHEVNTPLAVISSYTQMLSKQMGADPRISPILDKITKQSFRASEIVNGLLNFSRTGSTEFATLDLHPLLRDTLTLIEHQLKTARIEVHLQFAAQPALVHGNPGKLQQVMLNLLMNARDSMLRTEAPKMVVVTEVQARRILVRVVDTGSGISPENLARIYDPFFTTKTQPRPGEHKGTGLGLAVTYGIMQEHGGKIRAESVPDIGTTFELEFPALPAIVRPTPEPSSAERTALHV